MQVQFKILNASRNPTSPSRNSSCAKMLQNSNNTAPETEPTWRPKTSKIEAKPSKIEARGVLGTLGGASSSAKTAKSSEKARSKCLRSLRKFLCRRERGNFERESASSAPEERAGARAPEGKFRNLRMDLFTSALLVALQQHGTAHRVVQVTW